MLKRNGTRLSVIPRGTIHPTCPCGHSGAVLVSDILASKIANKYGPHITVNQALAHMRCAKCKRVPTEMVISSAPGITLRGGG